MVVLIYLLMVLLGQHIKIVSTFWFCLMSDDITGYVKELD
jgi:hypothetical protein